MRSPWWLYALVGFVGACHDTSETPVTSVAPMFQSGSRLRARVQDAGGGAVSFVEWFDSSLGVGCGFAPDSQGSLRCLPGVETTYFADPACSEPVIVDHGDDCVELPAYAVERLLSSPDACGQRDLAGLVVRRVGGPLGVGPTYQDYGDGCQLVGDYARFDAGEKVEPSVFVAVTESVEDRGGGLGARLLAAEDGALQVTGVVDLAAGAGCYPIQLGGANADAACVVEPGYAFTGYGELFVDSACSQPVTAAYTPSCEVPSALLHYQAGDCAAETITFHAVGDELFDLYSVQDGSCVHDDSATRRFALGPELAPGVLPTLRAGHAGDGPLRVNTFDDAAGRPLVTSHGWTNGLGESCYPVVFAADGPDTTRCVPAGYVELGPGFFADPGCTEPVAVHNPGPCAYPAPTLGLVYAASACLFSYTAAFEMIPSDGPLFSGDPSACFQVSLEDIAGPNGVILGMGAGIAIDTFPVVVVRTE